MTPVIRKAHKLKLAIGAAQGCPGSDGAHVMQVDDPQKARQGERGVRSNTLAATGIADTCYFGPEPEFFIFDSIRFGQDEHSAFYCVEPAEGEWRTGRDEGAYDGGNLGYKSRFKEGYFPVPPQDTLQDVRSEIARVLMGAGVQVEVHHHEVATAGQNEIDMRFAPLLRMADNVMIYKYACKNVARRHGKVATFMPKPIFADNASGIFVPAGAPDHSSGGDTSSPSAVYFGGIEPLFANADEVIVNMALSSFGSCAPIRVGPYLPSPIPCGA